MRVVIVKMVRKMMTICHVMIYVVCLSSVCLSVMRVFYDKTTVARMTLLLIKVAKCLSY